MIALADCAVTVSDAQSSARWWKEKVGFRVRTIGGAGHAIMIAPPGDRFVLHLCEGFGDVEPGNSGIAFVTDDIQSLVDRMQSNGVEFPEPLQKESWGSMAKFADPDGNVFWLLEAARRFIEQQTGRRGGPTRGPHKAPKRRARATPGRRGR